MAEKDKIIPINIEDEMKSAYIDYSMSVIVSRALPDVRDGLKPVHRRILHGMNELGLTAGKAHKKSARVVGEVLGKYHPHGDGSVYDAMVRLAQHWSLRYPLVNGQGNFGHIDGDGPAAMRYTEARLEKMSDDILSDIKKDTVDFQNNFDDSLQEPTVLPTRVPNLLVNGATGIAVGMATNMLPHNLSEVVDGIIATIGNPDITIDELMEHVKAPDFPTGGIIYGMEGVREAFHTGRGRVVLRGKAEIETTKTGKSQIIITEIPYQVNTANLERKIADLVKDEKIKGISGLRNESDRTSGLRIVVDLKNDAIPSVVLSQLYKYSPLQTSYGVNNVCLVDGRPRTLNLKQLIDEFIKFRINVVVRRTKYELKKAEERAHILEGLIIAVDNIDEVIRIIRRSKTVEEAKQGLIDAFDLSEIQAKAILEMRLQKLVSLEINKLREEYDEVMGRIEHYKAILASDDMQKDIVKTELGEVKEAYGDERRTQITYSDGEINIEDMIPNEEMVVSISNLGYIKRTKSDEFKQQGRGGRGSRGSKTRETDFVEHLLVANAHNYLLLFTELGRCFWIRVYEVPEASKTSSGRVIQNLIQLPKDDKVKAYIIIEDLKDEEFLDNNYILFCTKNALIKKTLVRDFSRVRTNGINAITINEGDQLMEAKLTNGDNRILIANQNGRAIHFDESKVRSMGRSAAGVRGIRLDEGDDQVVGMIAVNKGDENSTILVVSENGYGKRSLVDDYRVTNRGGKGVKSMQVTDKTGKVVSIKSVSDADDLMITTKEGIAIRMAVKDLRVMGRATQGVRVIRLDETDAIADLAVLTASDDKDELDENVDGETGANAEGESPENTDVITNEDVASEEE